MRDILAMLRFQRAISLIMGTMQKRKRRCPPDRGRKGIIARTAETLCVLPCRESVLPSADAVRGCFIYEKTWRIQ